MSRKRKTITIDELRDYANWQMSRKESDFCDDTSLEWKNGFWSGVSAMLEHFLHETHHYAGYGHVTWLDEGGYEAWVNDGKPIDTRPYSENENRKRYY